MKQLFTLRGTGDEKRIKACFSQELSALCLAEKGLVLEVYDGLLMLYWKNTIIPAEQYPQVAAKAVQFAETLKGAG
jgi:hypothetical protein